MAAIKELVPGALAADAAGNLCNDATRCSENVALPMTGGGCLHSRRSETRSKKCCRLLQAPGLAAAAYFCSAAAPEDGGPERSLSMVMPAGPQLPLRAGLREHQETRWNQNTLKKKKLTLSRKQKALLKHALDSEAHADSSPPLGMRSAAVAALSVTSSCLCALRQRSGFRRKHSTVASALPGTVSTLPASPSLPTVASLPMAVPSVDAAAVFGGLQQRTGALGRYLTKLPQALPMALFSTYGAVPPFGALAVLCPNPTQLARGLACFLGCLLGTVAGASFDRGKKEAARFAVLSLLKEHVQGEAMTVQELRNLISAARSRFGVASGRLAAEAFEDNALGSIYEDLLSAELEGPANDATDLPALQRVKAALDLDGTVVGEAHKNAAQKLVAKGERLEGEAMTRAVDKLLFLSERIFADDEPEEARLYEMSRVRQLLRVTDREAKQRISSVSRALYQQSLSSVVDKVDMRAGDALAGASAAFGLPSDEAAVMNTERYRQIAADLLKGGHLTAEGTATLKRTQGVLQLGDHAATAAFESVAAPIFRKDVDQVADGLREEAPNQTETSVTKLSTRCTELGLSEDARNAVITEGFTATLRSYYDQACKDARINGEEASLTTLDKMLAFASRADTVFAALAAKGGDHLGEAAPTPPITLAADSIAARRLYGLCLARGLDGDSMAAALPEKLAGLLELSQADEETARIEVCQPRLRKLYMDSIEKSEGQPAALPLAKLAIDAEKSKYQLPQEAVEETALEVYKARLEPLGGRVIKAPEKSMLDATRKFMGLNEDDVRMLHLKSFGPIYESSAHEAMGTNGIMSPEAKEALAQLRERFGFKEEDARKIFYNAVQKRLDQSIEKVGEAWEEATYTKEALAQLWKQRGKDVGDDPLADGTGGELGIKDTPVLEGVRGSELMKELTDMADFYVGNDVLVQDMKDMPPEYPVTTGKGLEDKVKEEMYGIYAWNTVTCQDTVNRDKWERCKPHVGAILGLSSEKMMKVLIRMVSRWANMFIKQKMGENGKLSDEDISTLTNWVPTFFGIDKDVTVKMVQDANKGMLVSKVLRLLNMPKLSSKDVQQLRDDVDSWDLTLEKDLELTRPQLRSLFCVEVGATLEEPDLTTAQKQDAIEVSREAFGLGQKEAADEVAQLLVSRCRGCLVNAVGDLMQGNETRALKEMQILGFLASFVDASDGLEVQMDWDVAQSMRQRLLKLYATSPMGREDGGAKHVDTGALERILDVDHLPETAEAAVDAS
eukprot:CAMPEP_0172837180 /NCGR_PEP_ID=MMETSP1075-20121228/27000_1 /TAXON_ID=2916 /ORGANISM="Ceratium fusus, Strain PA161109" /LENGTH=1247 /DNA_ID=CAMNT_0013680527 /DNA_START=1 /DNA_END=3744 /DNA_ORIENTATION=+